METQSELIRTFNESLENYKKTRDTLNHYEWARIIACHPHLVGLMPVDMLRFFEDWHFDTIGPDNDSPVLSRHLKNTQKGLCCDGVNGFRDLPNDKERCEAASQQDTGTYASPYPELEQLVFLFMPVDESKDSDGVVWVIPRAIKEQVDAEYPDSHSPVPVTPVLQA